MLPFFDASEKCVKKVSKITEKCVKSIIIKSLEKCVK